MSRAVDLARMRLFAKKSRMLSLLGPHTPHFETASRPSGFAFRKIARFQTNSFPCSAYGCPDFALIL